MRSFNVNRIRALWGLAFGPLLVIACSVYEDAPLGASGGMGSGSAGDGMGASSGLAGGGRGGDEPRAGRSSTSGQDTGGQAGNAVSGGGVGASSGNGSSVAGADGGGQTSTSVSIDDMEDTDQQITLDGGRNGLWYVGHDLTPGTQTPATGRFSMPELASPRDDSAYSAYMKASDFSDWGSVIGFNFVENPALAPYDASSYCGIQFWGKAAATTALRLRLPDANTHPAGGVCSTSGPADTLCYDHFSAAITLTANWKSFTVAFASLQQVGTGYHPSDKKFKDDQVFSVEWALPGTVGKTYEIWIDDVSFTPCP